MKNLYKEAKFGGRNTAGKQDFVFSLILAMAEVTQNESQNFTPKQNKLNRKTQHFGKKWIFLKYLTTTVSFILQMKISIQ